MERKIGEVFEYNGEWYQCLVENDYYRCKDDCVFYNKEYDLCDEESPECIDYKRSDNTNVIFKKLEKVGEPPCKSCYFGMVQLYKLPYWNNGMVEPVGCHFTGDGYVLIEIKQNKEDMEEKCDGCKYSDEEIEIMRKAGSEVIKVMGGELGIPEKIPYLYSFICGALELGWLDKYKCQSGKLCPFDLEAARRGKPVCTRDGRKARIICFDAKGDKPIIALVEAKGNKDALIEKVERYFINGHSVFEVRETNNDLMMLPEKKEGWVNVYKGGLLDTKSYNTKKEAFDKASPKDYIDTVKIEWEE